jgi:hypothetical protein
VIPLHFKLPALFEAVELEELRQIGVGDVDVSDALPGISNGVREPLEVLFDLALRTFCA